MRTWEFIKWVFEPMPHDYPGMWRVFKKRTLTMFAVFPIGAMALLTAALIDWII